MPLTPVCARTPSTAIELGKMSPGQKMSPELPQEPLGTDKIILGFLFTFYYKKDIFALSNLKRHIH